MRNYTIKILFWCVWTIIGLAGCFFIMYNAAWLIGDDSQVITYTGWGKPIFGFFVDPSLGRFFPLNYTLYDILCIFYDGRIGPMSHYFIHAVCFVIFCLSSVLTSMLVLKNAQLKYKYLISLLFIVVIVGRTYVNFIQLWTGIWTIYVFLMLFIYLAIKFFENKNWCYGIFALLSLNYVLYYYETMFTIPVAIGASSLLFNYKNQNRAEKNFNWILISSGILFLVLYAILVLPKVEHFYHHYSEDSLLYNAWKMFFAQKIMWIVVAFGALRVYSFVCNRTTYTFYDSLLVASIAYFCGAAILHLNYTLYYTPATLCALPAILFFCNYYFKEKWTVILFVCLALFYGRKIPADIKANQENRVGTVEKIKIINSHFDDKLYYYEPSNKTLNEEDLSIRSCYNYYIKTLVSWYRNDKNFEVEKVTSFDGREGIWIVFDKDLERFVLTYPDVESLGFEIGPLYFFRIDSDCF